MSMERIELEAGFSISRIIKGSWQLSKGHSNLSTEHVIRDMVEFTKHGITTLDCADIYTGVEEQIGEFIRVCKKQNGNPSDIQVLTKFVPDYDVLNTITKQYVEKVIDRSLLRLGLDQLDMVQFSWWNYAIPKWIETAVWLKELQQAGKIRLLGGTNFNTASMRAIQEAGVHFTTVQVQYSLLDYRPEKELVDFCRENNTWILCYGSVAGGFLSARWLNQPEPVPPYENRSLIKYHLMIQEFGGWDLFQHLLQVLEKIALKHQVSITNVASRYMLEQPQVGSLIIGARDAYYLKDNLTVFSFRLDDDDYTQIHAIIRQRKGPYGDVFDLERIKDGPHGSIMRYNLNQLSL
jgi:aryl-alcohol dehydrogenase-like predicted oxidoreductase